MAEGILKEALVTNTKEAAEVASEDENTQETLADTTLIRIGEGILKEALVTKTKEAAEVASEDEDTEVSEVG